MYEKYAWNPYEKSVSTSTVSTLKIHYIYTISLHKKYTTQHFVITLLVMKLQNKCDCTSMEKSIQVANYTAKRFGFLSDFLKILF